MTGCKFCKKNPARDNQVALFRINPKGGIGKWLCYDCLETLDRRFKLIRQATVAMNRDSDKHRTESRMVEIPKLAFDNLIQVVDLNTKEWEQDFS